MGRRAFVRLMTASVALGPWALQNQRALAEESAPDPATAPAAAPATEIRFYSWARTKQSNIAPMLRARFRKSIPEARAEAQSWWHRTEIADRCILLAPLRDEIEVAFNHDLRKLIVEGPSDAGFTRWWDNYLWMLDKNGLVPHRLAIDIEHGFGYWHRPDDRVSETDRRSPGILSVFADPAARAALPPEIAALDPNTIALGGSRQALAMWNAFTGQRVAEWVRRTFVEPLWQKFPDVRVSNYHDAQWGSQVVDENGWPRSDRMAGNDASPSLYSEDPARNFEQMDSIIAGLGRPPVPWIACPSIMTWESFEATLRGCVKRGCLEFLFFNPGAHREPEAQRRASELLASLQSGEAAGTPARDDSARGTP